MAQDFDVQYFDSYKVLLSTLRVLGRTTEDLRPHNAAARQPIPGVNACACALDMECFPGALRESTQLDVTD